MEIQRDQARAASNFSAVEKLDLDGLEKTVFSGYSVCNQRHRSSRYSLWPMKSLILFPPTARCLSSSIPPRSMLNREGRLVMPVCWRVVKRDSRSRIHRSSQRFLFTGAG